MESELSAPLTFKETIQSRLPSSVVTRIQNVLNTMRRGRHTFRMGSTLAKNRLLKTLFRELVQQRKWQLVGAFSSLQDEELEKIIQARTSSLKVQQSIEKGPTVTIVLLSLDRFHLTKTCLDSIYANSDYPFQVLIFDNGSHPDTITQLQKLESTHENLSIIYHDKNLGVAGGRNAAFSAVTTDYIMCLDNDVICHKGWLRELMHCAVAYEADLVSPMVLANDGSVWSCGADLVRVHDDTYIEVYPWFHGWQPEDVQAIVGEGQFTADFINGCAGLYRTEVFHACGRFPDYFVGWEDLDFSLTASQRQITAWVEPKSRITHDHNWEPKVKADIAYLEERYDIGALQAAASQFEERWGIKVFPEKFVVSTQTKVSQKMEMLRED
ncbi:MAG: glycosyltransferase [Chloroflexota bacterium]